MSDDTALVQSGKFDLLVQKIEQKKEEQTKYIEYQNQLRAILKSIMSVYFFLTQKMDMPRDDLSLEDFEIAEEKLKELAKEKIKGRWHKFWAKLGVKTAWQYYHEFKFFHYRNTPFGPWYYSATGLDWHNWDTFSPRFIAAYSRGYAVPPNSLALMDKIYQKKSGAKSGIVEPRLY